MYKMEKCWVHELQYVLIFMCMSIAMVRSHGRMMDPPQRTSMWRFGYNVSANYNDNGQNCGGMSNQWEHHGGKCDVCGAPWQGPRENEPPGKYARGIIYRTYCVSEQISVTIDITANHKGYFEFRLCPHNQPNFAANHDCLNKHLLKFADPVNTTRYYIGSKEKLYKLKLQLPLDVTCTQFVLQWKYHSGNSWGCYPDRNCCVGCGEAQEEFYGCADIAISGSNDSVQKVTASTANVKSTESTTQSTQMASSFGTTPTVRKTTMRCFSIGVKKSRAMTTWCKSNCARGYCPTSLCKCRKKKPKFCRAVAAWRNVECLNTWCKQNCPNTCPAALCTCK